MDGVEGQVQALREQVHAAQLHRARAEAQRDAAQARIAELLAALESDFGVTSIEQAKERQAELDATVERLLTEAQVALEGIE